MVTHTSPPYYTTTQDDTEMQLLQQADKIEAAKKAEAAKQRPSSAPGAGAGDKGVGRAPTPTQAFELEYMEVAPAPTGVCSLFDANLKPFQPPKPGEQCSSFWGGGWRGGRV